jgi:hypothetical protein
MTRFIYLIPVLLLAACTDPTIDDQSDGEAEAAAPQLVGKEDGVSFTGVYRTHTTALKDGDVPNVELLTNAKPGLPTTYSYVRSRCYHTNCSARVPETDTYDVYTTSAGKTYVRFWTFTITDDPNDGRIQHPVVGDVYEITTFSHGIKLRKSYSTRWQTLYTASPSLMCSTSHGTWASGDCTCPGNVPGTWPATIFISGAGGCIATPGSDESNCDASGGLWTDDDATLIGAFCMCGRGRYDNASGSCAAI